MVIENTVQKMNFSHLNFGNNFVSMHQFSTATKVVGNVQQNIAFIPATSSQHYHHSNQISFPNNGQITTAVIQHQHHYQDASTRILSQNSSSHSVNINTPASTTTAQTSWVDGVSTLSSGDNTLKINLPSFPPHTQGCGNNLAQPMLGSFKTVVMKDASTMTDFEASVPEVRNVNDKETIISEDSDDSSKSGTHSLKKTGCSNSCSKVELKSNRSALSEYLLRLQPYQIPQDIQNFLKDNNILPNNVLPALKNDVEQKVKKNVETKDALNPGRPEIRLSNAPDGSLLFCCTECNIGYPDKEQLERHLTVHKPDRRFECNVCGVFLKRKEHLDQHKRGHSEERPFVCEICCKGFKRNEHLRRHIVIHSGDKNHVCTECGKAFSRKDHLNKHLQTHISKRGKGESNEPTSPLLHFQSQKHVHAYTSK